MWKVRSLASNQKVIPLQRSQREYERERMFEEDPEVQSREQHWEQVGNMRVPKHLLELNVFKPDMPEAFNKKVFDLIDLALDDARKRQMPVLWCPWF